MIRSGTAREWAAVAAVFGTLVLVAAVWLALDRRPPEWDHANHLERAVLCARDLAVGDWRAIVERSSFYPPLVICAAAVAYRLAPSDVASAQAVVLAFLGLGMAATYLLGRRLAGGRAGVLGAVIFGTAPFVVFSSLRFQLDLPLAAMVALALWALLGTERFASRPWSLLLGIVLGLGALTKPPFVVYLLPPLVLVAAGLQGRRAAVNLAGALVVGAGLALPWYGPRLLGIPAQISARSFSQAAESGHPEPLTWAGLMFYPAWLPAQLGLVATVLLVVGLALAVIRRRWVAVMAFVVPFVALFLLQNKNLRYTLPLLPLAAVLAGSVLAPLRGRLQMAAAALLLLAGGFQVSATAFGMPRQPRLAGLELAIGSPPSRGAWRHREVLELIARDSGGAPVTVSVVPNHNFFSPSNFRYYGLADGRPVRVTRAWDGEPLGVDYMILKSGDVGPSWTAEKPRRIAARLTDDSHLAKVFPVIGAFDLPDGSVATVRARRIPPELDLPPATVAAAVDAALRSQMSEVARDIVGLTVTLDYDAAVLRGRLRRIEVAAAAATLAEFRRRDAARLRVRDLRVVLEDVLINPFSAVRAGRLDPLDVGRLRLEQATLTGRDVQEFLAGLKRFRHTSLALGDGVVAVAIEQPGPDVTAQVKLTTAPDRPFALLAEAVRVGGVPVPSGLVNWVIRHYDPSPRLAARLPMPVEVGHIVVTPEAIRIVPRPAAREARER